MENRRPIKLFLLALLVPVIVLLSMLVKPMQAHILGEEIQLATVPVDPRDLLYGDYVQLKLDIENVDPELLDRKLYDEVIDSTRSERIPVYVSLERNEDNLFEVKNVSMQKPNALYMKGELYPYIHKEWLADDGNNVKPYVIIDYGLDRFYVEEGTGIELEKLSQEGEVIVTAKVYNGYTILTNIAERVHH